MTPASKGTLLNIVVLLSLLLLLLTSPYLLSAIFHHYSLGTNVNITEQGKWSQRRFPYYSSQCHPLCTITTTTTTSPMLATPDPQP